MAFRPTGGGPGGPSEFRPHGLAFPLSFPLDFGATSMVAPAGTATASMPVPAWSIETDMDAYEPRWKFTLDDIPWCLRPFKTPAEVAAFAGVFGAAFAALCRAWPESPQRNIGIAFLVAIMARPTDR